MSVNNGFSRAERLSEKAEFNTLFASGARLKRNDLQLIYRKTEVPYCRLGMVVPKRLVRSAVDRNRIKRLIRESFRQNKVLLPNMDLVVILRHAPQATDPSYNQVTATMAYFWSSLCK